MEDVARQALGVDTDEHVLGSVDVALDECDVVPARQRLAEGDGRELAVPSRQPDGRRPLDQLLVPAAILDQVGNRDQAQAVPLAVRDQIVDAGHRPVLVHDLADDAGRDQTGEAGEVDGRLGLAAALENAAVPGTEREDVPRPDEVVSALAAIDRDLDGAGPVMRGDARGDPLAGLDRDGEGGPERRLVALGHRLQTEFVAALLGQAEADQPAAVRCHEVDRLGRRELSRDRQVAFVLAIGSVDHDHELALADVLDRLLDGRERRLFLELGCHPLDRTAGLPSVGAEPHQGHALDRGTVPTAGPT